MGRTLIFVLVASACVAVGAGSVVLAALGDDETTSDAHVVVGRAARVTLRGALMVRAVDPHDERLNGRVTSLTLGMARHAVRGRLDCQRVYFAGGRGICLMLEPSGVDYSAKIFDRRQRVVGGFGLQGLPSRTRVSADGRFGSVTTFVTGDTYTNPGEFSTRTTLVDMRTGRQLVELEQFKVFLRGREIEAPDFNFWGVTFERDSERFYATLGTGDHHYLVHGSLRTRRIDVLRDRVECPSLSPDGTQIAYKALGDKPGDWRLHVLDVKTLRDRPLAERRSIDDQAEWLDDATVVYSDGMDVWAVRADGSGSARRVLRHASSPARLE